MRCLLWSLLVLLGFQAKAQCSVDVVNDSLYACEGDSVTLQALGTGPFAWTPAVMFSCDTCATTHARMGAVASAAAVSTQSSTSQAAVNGDFSAGNSGFWQ